MADRPIIFSAAMVRALLDGRKTQTRRLATSPLSKCQAGDRLWVREAWAIPEPWGNRSAKALAESCLAAGYEFPWAPICYTANGARQNWGEWRQSPPGKGRPSIHMPRWASRLTLVVTEVRRQHLRDITMADSVAEGLLTGTSAELGVHEDVDGDLVPDRRPDFRWYWGDDKLKRSSCPRTAYFVLWDALHGAAASDNNTAVIALTFTAHHANIDALDEERAA